MSEIQFAPCTEIVVSIGAPNWIRADEHIQPSRAIARVSTRLFASSHPRSDASAAAPSSERAIHTFQ